MTYDQVVKNYAPIILPQVTALYQLENYVISQIEPHEGGRNLVYSCSRAGDVDKIIRIVFLMDRGLNDLLSETQYIRFLYEQGASVSNVVNSRNGLLVEVINYDNQSFYICVFEKAKGKMLVENNYRYREGASITEYFYNCGKTLGKMHQLSKEYRPVHKRYSFFDKYNAEYINNLIPDSFPLLKVKISEILGKLKGLEQDNESYGLVHFDYSDGNYRIDFHTGQITVYDFDNSCYCWYMYDLANLWVHGVGWIQFEPDTNKRREFMEEYFQTILKGYQSETTIKSIMLDKLRLMIQVTLVESVVDFFEVKRNADEEPVCDEELTYIIKCIEEDIPYKGFFHEIYSCEAPFEYELQGI